MSPLIPLLALLSVLLFQVASHRCVLRDTPNQPATTLPHSRINDDYCDCLDGSDEYRTSACPNGTFVCANAAYRKKSIPSSWVRDGSCDCCDGSDEAPGQCPNSCGALRERDMKEAKQRADTVMRGVATRQTYVKVVSSAIEKDARELRKLERELAAIERAFNKSKARADSLRRRRDWQSRSSDVERSSPASSSTHDPPSTAERHVHDDEDDYDYEHHIKDDEESGEPNGKVSDSDKRKDDDEQDDPKEEDEPEDDDFEDDEEDDFDDEEDDEYDDNEDVLDNEEDHEDEDEEEDDHFDDEFDNDEEEAKTSDTATEKDSERKQEDDTGSDSDEYSQESASTSEQGSKPDVEPEVEPEPSLNVDSICAELESSGFSHIFRIAAYARAVVLSKLHRMLPRIFPVRRGSAISGLDECIRQADSAKWKFQSQKSDIEEKIKKLKKKQTTDYGTDKALRKLHGECTKSKVLQYEFEHCAFDLVRQYEHGSAIATLGRFEGWEVNGNERYMKYTNGDTCWNGPARSIKVQLLCGEKEDIVSVDEPNRCTYFMKFRTPAVCEKEMADEIMSAFETGSDQKEEL